VIVENLLHVRITRVTACGKEMSISLTYLFLLCSTDSASYNMAIIIQQDATKYSLFKSVNCSTCFGWYFTHHQGLITYIATCRERQVAVTVSLMPDTVDTVI